jgi:redox-sensitive bicupin YhaK (pirin superfamily)
MNVRAIRYKVSAEETIEGAEATVKRVFPSQHLLHFDPFVLLDEFLLKPPASFPDHPHGGFEAITYMLEGGFHHHDNLGNDSIVLAGGLQRFIAGKGIVHSEMPGTNGPNRGLQLWVRLPSRLRDMEPDYEQVEPSAIPEETLNGSHIRIIVGGRSPIKLQTNVIYLDVTLQPENKFVYKVDPEFNVMLYVLNGIIILDRSKVRPGEAALLTLGEDVEVATQEMSKFVLIGGKPHREHIILSGSFVY